MFELIKEMQIKFGIQYDGPPRQMPKDEFEFRMKAFHEEIGEYVTAYDEGNIEEQFDALIDLVVFAMGAAEKQGFDFEEGFKRVMAANMQKQMVTSAVESKRGHKQDLIKPEGWRAPYLGDLVTAEPSLYKGVIILEGPDCCGKTTLGKHLEEGYGAMYIHSTWSHSLEERMTEYLAHSANIANAVSRNQLVVLDRHWVSDLVYADVFRDGHTRSLSSISSHSELLGYENRMLVMCLPKNIEQIATHFDNEKAKRDEMYEDISDVAKAYLSLWEGNNGIYNFKNKHDYVEEAMKHGGLKSHHKTISYDWTTQGHDLDAFCNYILEGFHG